MALLTILILPIHEYRTCFHILISYLISFFTVLKFLSDKYFTCLVRGILRYFILIEVIVNGMISLMSFSVCLSFVLFSQYPHDKYFPLYTLHLWFLFKNALQWSEWKAFCFIYSAQSCFQLNCSYIIVTADIYCFLFLHLLTYFGFLFFSFLLLCFLFHYCNVFNI